MARPNVILFMTDGHRTDMLGCYGNEALATPEIDAVARDGMLFRRAFCPHSVCMPTRASVYTGRYPHVHGVWANGVTLPADEITLPQLLHEEGYATCAAGKVHFEPQQAYMAEATRFSDGVQALCPSIDTSEELYYGFGEVHLSENLLGTDYIRFIEEQYPDLLPAVRKRRGVPEEAHELKWITDQAIDFIGRQAEAEKPFFCHCSFHELSPPCTPPAEFAGYHDPAAMPVPVLDPEDLAGKPPFYRQCYDGYVERGRQPDGTFLREAIASCYDQMRFIDKQFGRIMQALRLHGVEENTIVIFMADHGLSLNDHWQWRHGPFLFDEVTNIPMIWRVPGAARGVETMELVESVDVMPTVLELCGVAVPRYVQGESLTPLLNKLPGAKGKEAVLLQERQAPDLACRGVDPSTVTQYGLRTKDWKLIRYADEVFGELYNLQDDPGEFRNLWDDNASATLRSTLEHQLSDMLYRLGPPLPDCPYDW